MLRPQALAPVEPGGVEGGFRPERGDLGAVEAKPNREGMLGSCAEAETLVTALEHGAHAGVRWGAVARGFLEKPIGKTGIQDARPEGLLRSVDGLEDRGVLDAVKDFNLRRSVDN